MGLGPPEAERRWSMHQRGRDIHRQRFVTRGIASSAVNPQLREFRQPVAGLDDEDRRF
jgi:hypothetical protein